MRNKIFISYSHKDALYKLGLKTHLKPFEHLSEIEEWDDDKLAVGENFHKQIDQIIEETAVAILLVSKDYLASDFIMHKELIPLLDAWKKDKIKIILIVLTYCVYTEIDMLKNIQAFNDPAKPLCLLSPNELDAEWVEVAKMARAELQKYIENSENSTHDTGDQHKKKDTAVFKAAGFNTVSDTNGKLLPDKAGWYHAKISEIRENLSEDFRCYRLNKLICSEENEPVENETHWIFFNNTQFIDLSVGDNILFKIDKVDELKNWFDGLTNARNVYITELFISAKKQQKQ
ncbi:MAG: toll/interleukin-1 receptor domain-containing protein [Peptococcaceae bacterium]|nr:toll/interleukin-1 receptor domain-containing protein [Peptococcaceae bacterium]